MADSLFVQELHQCPVCLNEETVTIWQVIDAAADPDLKDKLLRKELLAQPCSNCGHTWLLGRPLLYRDPDRRLLYYCHAGETAAEGRAAVRQLPPAAGWQLRLIPDFNQLIEKIHIADHQCDDRLIEFIKLAVIRQGEQEVEVAAIHFLTANDQTFRFLLAGADSQWYSLDLESQIYLNAEELTAGHLPDISGEWQVIGQDYAAQLLQELAAAAANQQSAE